MLRTKKSSTPMPVKYWSSAGLILTYWCSSRCASCYLCCGPDRRGAHEQMTVPDALAYWRGLVAASPRGCRIHLTGGEPFGDWPRLIELCRCADRQGLLKDGPLVKVETNAFWATDEKIVRERISQLKAVVFGRGGVLAISADPYHQQYVPIARCRLAARVGSEVLGADRVQVRWRDWLAEGFDVPADQAGRAEAAALFAKYLPRHRERINGRAGRLLGRYIPGKPPAFFADNPCRGPLLRSRHVHVDPEGFVIPGTCGGIVLGRIRSLDDRCRAVESVSQIWRRLSAGGFRVSQLGFSVVECLADHGPVELMRRAKALGYAPVPDGYASKCHLCWEVRRFLVDWAQRAGGGFAAGLAEELAPAGFYQR